MIVYEWGMLFLFVPRTSIYRTNFTTRFIACQRCHHFLPKLKPVRKETETEDMMMSSHAATRTAGTTGSQAPSIISPSLGLIETSRLLDPEKRLLIFMHGKCHPQVVSWVCLACFRGGNGPNAPSRPYFSLTSAGRYLPGLRRTPMTSGGGSGGC